MSVKGKVSAEMNKIEIISLIIVLVVLCMMFLQFKMLIKEKDIYVTPIGVIVILLVMINIILLNEVIPKVYNIIIITSEVIIVARQNLLKK